MTRSAAFVRYAFIGTCLCWIYHVRMVNSMPATITLANKPIHTPNGP